MECDARLICASPSRDLSMLRKGVWKGKGGGGGRSSGLACEDIFGWEALSLELKKCTCWWEW